MKAFLLYAQNQTTFNEYRNAGKRIGLQVVALSGHPASFLEVYVPGSVVRAPGGLIAQAIRLGAPVRLYGPTPAWFVDLGPAITARTWQLGGPSDAAELIREGPTFVKLADAKDRSFPARRFRSPHDLHESLKHFPSTEGPALLMTRDWLSIHSEYRVFTRGRSALTTSPYQIEDELWTPLLHAHRASFHHQATDFIAAVLEALPDSAVPPAAAMDVARLTDGTMCLLEANQAWAAALYGCDPHAALQSVLAANAFGVKVLDEGYWQWTPDQGLAD